MKTLFTFALVVLMASTLYATNPANVSVKAKSLNLNEFTNTISYPLSAREQAIEGTVCIILKVNEYGDVVASKLTKYPSVELKETVENEIKNLKFTPAKNEFGENIESFTKLKIDFKLN